MKRFINRVINDRTDDYRVKHYRTKKLDDNGNALLPNIDDIDHGEIVINYAHGKEVIVSKDSSNGLGIFESIDYLSIINVDKRFPLETGFYDSVKAYGVIPETMRKHGLIIYYKTSENRYAFEQFTGDDIELEWSNSNYWKPVNGIIDNLESTSVDESLSANQGKILNERINFLNNVLLPMEMSTSVSPGGYSKRGVPINVTYSWSVKRKGYESVEVGKVYIDDVIQPEKPMNKSYNLSDSKTIKVKVVSSDGLSVEKSITKSFTEALYAGVVDEGFSFTEENIKKYEKGVLTTSKGYSSFLGVIPTPKISFYAYPKKRGNLSNVKDGNGFDITDLYKNGGDWNIKTVQFVINERNEPYIVYYSNPFKTAGAVTHIFN